MKIFNLLLILGIITSCSSNKFIQEKPIVFDEQRIELTKEYLKGRYELKQETITIIPRMIVVHWTAIASLEDSFDAFKRPTLPSWRPDLTTISGLNVSSHFLVDQDGTVYRLMPENHMARHVIGLNHCAIGIENVGGTENTPLTQAQLKANIKLIKYLKNKYAIDYLIGHHEYTLFEDHPLWLEVNDGYRTTKTDPGPEFMAELRMATLKLNFKPLPK
ncbi:N-acetylmuramoyl-L-alanine amidase [Croceivirga sp. JEA036]|uniref:N-acetylmuramoyl-L-alanine amidase n=1 Tax=Croceivirga sp. JEA036 TaxID=2721162 RepID=UPI00143ADA56|nr:peptidoglycan recognition family protein [Croceivirga sp. JEA036]NJB35625.1 N-acetylmuramoyl-L-alanine amidase [Croceivirga sp. JEA036]